MSSKVVVLGGGSWGTTLAVLLAESGNSVTLWEFNKEYAEMMQKERKNNFFVKDLIIPDEIIITNELNGILDDAEVVILATPSQFLRNILMQISPQIKENLILVNVSKGIEIKSGKRMSEVIKDEIFGKFHSNIVILSGPTHAEEVALKKPSAIVSASNCIENAEKIQKLFSTKHFRVYTSNDMVGVELGGALKNCIAIAAGVVDGLGHGDNTKSALMARGLAEMMRFGEYFGAEFKTFSGLSGIGDLITTCTSQHSRNRFVGEQLGKGKTLQEIQSEMKMVAEGIPTVKAVYEQSKKIGLDMPIIESLYEVLYNNRNPENMIDELMSRELKNEFS